MEFPFFNDVLIFYVQLDTAVCIFGGQQPKKLWFFLCHTTFYLHKSSSIAILRVSKWTFNGFVFYYDCHIIPLTVVVIQQPLYNLKKYYFNYFKLSIPLFLLSVLVQKIFCYKCCVEKGCRWDCHLSVFNL